MRTINQKFFITLKKLRYQVICELLNPLFNRHLTIFDFVRVSDFFSRNSDSFIYSDFVGKNLSCWHGKGANMYE
jgi:hypothetical protein